MLDYHIHTDHSDDGTTPLRAMVEAAIGKGLREICITSHYDVDAPPGKRCRELDLPAYVADVRRCAQAYAERISIKLGVEAGLQADKPSVLTATAESIRSWPFDFVIASTHFLAALDGLCLEAVMRIEKKRLQALYLGHTIRCVERFDDFDVIGHLTYYSRYATGASKAAREMAYEDNKALYDQLFALLIARGKGLEINTSVKGTKDLFIPDYSIAKRFHRMGGRVVTIGSDAHVPQQVGTCVDQAIEMLREAGFTAVCRFDRRMPVFTDI